MTTQSRETPSFALSARALLFTATALTLLPAAASAQNAPESAEAAQNGSGDDNQSVVLPSLNMAGAASQSEISTNDTSATATITRQEIERRPSGFILNDVIKRLPGVFTGGAPGEDKDLRLRGLDKEFSRLQVDGIQLPGGGEKREFNLDILPNALIGSVTVIRNGGAEFEADGLTGRIHVETRDIPKDQQIDVDVALGGFKLGSDDGYGASLAYGDRFANGFGLQGAVSIVEEPATKSKDKFNPAGRLTENESEDRPLKRYAVDLDAAYFWETGEFHLRGKYLDSPEDKSKIKTRFNATTGARTGFDLEEEQKPRKTYGGGLTLNQTIGEATSTEASLGYYVSTETKDKLKQVFNAAGVEQTAQRETEIEDKEDGFWQGDLKLVHDWNKGSGAQFSAGLSGRIRDRFKTKDRIRNGILQTPGSKDIFFLDENYFAGYVQNRFVLTDTLQFLPGLRIENVAITSRDRVGRVGRNSDTDIIPTASLTWRPAAKLSFHGAASRKITRPKFDELSPFVQEDSSKFVLGNPDLRPAKAWAYDAGVEYSSKYVTLGANLFYRDISDVIETRFTGEFISGKPIEQLQNVGNGWLRGLELEQRISLRATGIPFIRGFTFTANQSFLDSELRNFNGKVGPFKEQPKFLGNIIVDWEEPNWGTAISVAGNYVSEVKNSANGDGRGEEFVIDAKFTQRITDSFAFNIRGSNLTRKERIKLKANGEIEREASNRQIFIGLTARF